MIEKLEKICYPIELITPELAKQYLKRNSSCNKPLEEDKVNALVEKINSGKWDSNGDAIYFDHGDVLANGQHRCMQLYGAKYQYPCGFLECLQKNSIAHKLFNIPTRFLYLLFC